MPLNCSGVLCGAAAVGCYPPGFPVPCACRPLFNGPTCEGHYFTDRLDLFWSLHVMALLFFLALFGFGVGLLFFYFRSVRPSDQLASSGTGVKKRTSPQLVGLCMVIVATLLRVIYGLLMVSVGPRIEFEYYLNPSFLQWLGRLSYGAFYPLVFLAYSLQVLTWIDLLAKTKAMKMSSGSRWMWIVFMTWVALLCVLELTIEFLLLANVNAITVIRAYRGIFSVFLLALLVLVLYFGIRFLFMTRSGTPASALNEQRRESRRNLTRLVLCTACLSAGTLALILAITIALLRTASDYFLVMFLLGAIDVLACLLIEVTFLSMMRNRLRNRSLAKNGATTGRESSASGEELSQPLMDTTYDVDEMDNDSE